MRLNRTLALGASLLVLLGACSTGSTPSPSSPAASVPAASTPAEIAIGRGIGLGGRGADTRRHQDRLGRLL